jgi:hypothetical protein
MRVACTPEATGSDGIVKLQPAAGGYTSICSQKWSTSRSRALLRGQIVSQTPTKSVQKSYPQDKTRKDKVIEPICKFCYHG